MGLDIYINKNGKNIEYLEDYSPIQKFFEGKFGKMVSLKRYKLTKELLEELFEKCTQIINEYEYEHDNERDSIARIRWKHNEELCSKILPFSNEYELYANISNYGYVYLACIKNTYRMLKEIFNTVDFDNDVIEYYSFWDEYKGE